MAGLLQQRKEAAGWWNRLSSAGQGYRPLQAEARSPNVDQVRKGPFGRCKAVREADTNLAQPDSLSPYPPSSPNPSDEPGRFAVRFARSRKLPLSLC